MDKTLYTPCYIITVTNKNKYLKNVYVFDNYWKNVYLQQVYGKPTGTCPSELMTVENMDDLKAPQKWS